ncbi:hypothetical protein ACL02T_07175 [Pseudonocardia sp. RS010]|uniref:hypothetical protein n=1 Tax=Pseudonocardia sp. RS010 TaxID=3385979 RepID=UPI0039A1E689
MTVGTDLNGPVAAVTGGSSPRPRRLPRHQRPGAQPAIDTLQGEEGPLAAHLIRRLGDPADATDAVLFRCSDTSSQLTGQILSGGGRTMAE